MVGYGFAQSIERSVFASSGNFSSTSSMSISSTLGEVFVTTLSSSSSTLTQGFQQPTSSGGVGVEEIDIVNFSVYPNPFQDIINIKSSIKGNYTISIVDVLGRNLNADLSPINSSGKLDMIINLEHYQSGLYFLKIYNDDNHMKTIKIQKQ